MKTQNAIVGSLFLLAAASVLATPITYDFTGVSPYGLGIGSVGSSVTVGSPAITISAFSGGVAGDLNTYPGLGLGVSGDPGLNWVGGDEWIHFDFSPLSVTALESVVFARGTEAGSLGFWVDGILAETISWTAAGGTPLTHVFGPGLTGSTFEFRAITDSFRVMEFTVDAPGVPDGGASWLLLSLGMAGVVLGRISGRK